MLAADDPLDQLQRLSQDQRAALSAAIQRGTIRGDEVREQLTTAADAERYARRAIETTFDADELRRQMPLAVADHGSTWTVRGASAPDILRGPLTLELRKSDAEVVELHRIGPRAPE